jgi:hypothetical protein
VKNVAGAFGHHVRVHLGNHFQSSGTPQLHIRRAPRQMVGQGFCNVASTLSKKMRLMVQKR